MGRSRIDLNRDFGLEVLYQIATDRELPPAGSRLVLKGGAALFHAHNSGRGTVRDLDFGLLEDFDASDQRFVDELLASLDDWDARLDTTKGQPVTTHRDGVKIWVVFRHPENKQIGRMQIEVSRRAGTIPPRMLDGIKERHLVTYDGEAFAFKTLAPEEIAAEKIIRLFRVDKAEGPRQQDLHDIGFIYSVLGVDDDTVCDIFDNLVTSEGHLCRFEAKAK